MSKMKHSTAEVIFGNSNVYPELRQILYSGKVYTAYGRLFAVRGQWRGDDFFRACEMRPHYNFFDWNTMSGMYREEAERRGKT